MLWIPGGAKKWSRAAVYKLQSLPFPPQRELLRALEGSPDSFDIMLEMTGKS